MKKIIYFICLFAALTLFNSCPEEDPEEEGPTPPPATTLTENIWTDGNITASDKEQYFKFTATASTHYIHVEFGTLNDMYVQLYTKQGIKIGNKTELYSSKYTSYSSFTAGQVYYIQITPFSSSYKGTFKITFCKTNKVPLVLPSNAIQLTAATWADGTLTGNGEQWFKFIATAATQFIHINFDSLSSLYIQLYNNSNGYGNTVGDRTYLSSSNKYISRSLSLNQEYYIKVEPGSSSNNGLYQIAFNTSATPPSYTPITLPTDAIQLFANTWTDGNIPTSSDIQWFKFNVTNSGTQYIHVSLGTFDDMLIQVYDGNSNTVKSKTNLWSSTKYTLISSLTVGQDYYIKVWPYYSSKSGTYKITFNTSQTPPPAP